MNDTERRETPVLKTDDQAALTAMGNREYKSRFLKAFEVVLFASAITFGLGNLLAIFLELDNVMQNVVGMSSMWLGMSIGMYFAAKKTTGLSGRLLLSMSWLSIWVLGALGGAIPLVLALKLEIAGWPLVAVGAVTIPAGIGLGFAAFALSVNWTYRRRGIHPPDTESLHCAGTT